MITLLLQWAQKVGRVAIASALLITLFGQVTAYASAACSASVSPNEVNPATYSNFQISLNNTGTANIQWIDITVPSDKFSYAGNSISNWSTADHAGGTTLTGSSLAQNSSENLTVGATIGALNGGPANWHVQVSTDPSGANPVDCTDAGLDTTIVGYPPNDSANGVSNIAANDISDTSATITWDSDSPTSSIVYYGKTASYSTASAYDPTIGSSHSISITGLSASTGYHFQVAGNDSSGNAAYSADNTFLTTEAIVSNTGSGSSGVNTSTTSSVSSAGLAPHSVVIGKGTAADVIAPTITLDQAANGPFKTVPTLSGTASDDKGIAKVEYSTDKGKNWLPATITRIAGQPKVTYTFTPLLPQDGNYVTLAQATDTGGNITTTASQTIVIDRLPPIVGGNVVSSGPQISEPSSDGTIKSLEGVDQKITLSAVGGPTAITLEATTTVSTKKGPKVYAQDFSMTVSADTGLWSGVLSFARPGTYILTAQARDGAGNQTSRVLNAVHVSSPGHTWDKKTHKALPSTVTVFYLDPETHVWIVWDGQAFGQTNPQQTDKRTGKTGTFSMLLPAGTYYMQAKSPGYQTVVGSIFTVKQPTPLATDINLSPIHGLKLGNHYLSLPNMSVLHMSLSHDTAKNVNPNNLIGMQTPDFSLTDTTGATVHAADLLGQPTIFSFESTWSPTTAEQLSALAGLQSKSGINVVPVALQEQPDRVRAYTDTAGVKLRWLVDPDGTLSASYHVQSLPLHYFIDRKGIIKQVVVGVLSEQEMLDRLTGL